MQRVHSYVPSWNPGIVNRLNKSLCDTYIVAFATFQSDGTVIPPSNISTFTSGLKTSRSKVTLAIGGDTVGTDVWRGVANNSQARDRFASSCLQACRQYNLDGIDLDWEFPEPADRDSFVALHKALKQQLGGLMVTTAVSAGNWLVNQQQVYNISDLARYVDAVHLMTYDFHMDAEWDRAVGVNFNAPMRAATGGDSLENGIQLYVRGGMPKSKIFVGVPFYSRTYQLQNGGSHEPGAAFVVGNQARNPSDYVKPCSQVS